MSCQNCRNINKSFSFFLFLFVFVIFLTQRSSSLLVAIELEDHEASQLLQLEQIRRNACDNVLRDVALALVLCPFVGLDEVIALLMFV